MSLKEKLVPKSWSLKRTEVNTSDDGSQPSARAIIFQSELEIISRHMIDYPNIETGGSLFGYWTQNGTPIVSLALGPGPESQHESTFFEQDMDYVRRVGAEVYRRWRLQHIGEWHSHHHLGLDHPSGGDVGTMVKAVEGRGFPRMLLCIGIFENRKLEATVNPFNFHRQHAHNYQPAQWDIVSTESPYRHLINEQLGDLIIPPIATQPLLSASMRPHEKPTVPAPTHWLTERVENVEAMKQMVAEASRLIGRSDVHAEMHDNGEPAIALMNSDFEIVLPFGFPKKAPQLEQQSQPQPTVAEWRYPELDLMVAFHLWLMQVIYEYPVLYDALLPNHNTPDVEEILPPQENTEEPSNNETQNIKSI